MAKFTGTQTFADGDQVTATKLTAITSGLSASTDLAADATLTVTAGALKVGTITAANIGADAVTTVKVLDANITAAKLATDSVTTAKIVDSAVTAAKVAADAVAWTKTLTADRAVQADMQSETASHFVSPDVLKYHPGVCKVYGVVAFESASSAVTGGYNVTSATDTGSGRRINFAVTMANANYSVDIAYEDASGDPGIRITAKTTTSFTFDPIAGEASGRKFSFKVHGLLA